MQLHGMENWGAMTPSARLELLGNLVVDLAARIPDVAGGELDARPVTQAEFDALRDVSAEMVKLHVAIDLKLTDLFERVSMIESRPHDVAELVHRIESLDKAFVEEMAKLTSSIYARIDELNTARESKKK